MYCPVYNSQGEREYREYRDLNLFYNLLSVTANAAHVFDLGQKVWSITELTQLNVKASELNWFFFILF